jgi:hypothetical protein
VRSASPNPTSFGGSEELRKAFPKRKLTQLEKKFAAEFETELRLLQGRKDAVFRCSKSRTTSASEPKPPRITFARPLRSKERRKCNSELKELDNLSKELDITLEYPKSTQY